jgi:hypothetical protein
MERLALKMQQEEQVRWRYEWPHEEERKMACSKVVGQKETTSVEEVVEGS